MQVKKKRHLTVGRNEQSTRRMTGEKNMRPAKTEGGRSRVNDDGCERHPSEKRDDDAAEKGGRGK